MGTLQGAAEGRDINTWGQRSTLPCDRALKIVCAMSGGRRDRGSLERGQTTLFAYSTKKMKLQPESDITSLQGESTLADEDSGTESGESNTSTDPESNGSLSSDDECETQHGQSGGNQTITVHAPTTVIMNNNYIKEV